MERREDLRTVFSAQCFYQYGKIMLKNENQSYDVDTIIFSGRENELRKLM